MRGEKRVDPYSLEQLHLKSRNLLLARLPKNQLQLLSRDLVLVDLPAGMRVGEASEQMQYVYFPESGMISTEAVDGRGTSVQIYLTGREGFAGVAAAMKQPEMHHILVVQGAGKAWRLPARVLQRELRKDGPLLENFFPLPAPPHGDHGAICLVQSRA